MKGEDFCMTPIWENCWVSKTETAEPKNDRCAEFMSSPGICRRQHEALSESISSTPPIQSHVRRKSNTSSLPQQSALHRFRTFSWPTVRTNPKRRYSGIRDLPQRCPLAQSNRVDPGSTPRGLLLTWRQRALWLRLALWFRLALRLHQASGGLFARGGHDGRGVVGWSLLAGFRALGEHCGRFGL